MARDMSISLKVVSIAAPRRPPDKVAALPTLDAIKTLRRPEVAAFVISVFLMSTAVGVFYTFYPLYLRELEIADAWVGLIVNLGVLVEVFFMLGAGWLLNRMGVRGVMIAGAGAVVLRLGLLTFVPTAPVAIGTQVLHGPFVIAQYLVPVMYLNHKAADSHRNSMQGLYALLCFGLARVVGSIVGGHLSDAGAAAGDSHLFGLRVTLGFGFVLAVFAMGGLGLGFHDRPASEHLRAQHS